MDISKNQNNCAFDGDSLNPTERIRRIDRKLVHKGSMLSMYADTIEGQNGHRAIWDFIDHKRAAAVIPVTEDGKIIMVKQYRNALDRFTLEIPAGGIEPGEEMIDAAARELEEETGYKSKNLKLMIKVVTAVAFCNEVIDVFLAKDLVKSKQNLDQDEFIDVYACDPYDLRDMIFDLKIQDSKTISAIMAYINLIERRKENGSNIKLNKKEDKT